MLSLLTLSLHDLHVSPTQPKTVSLPQDQQNSVPMLHECDELSETTDGHETISLSLLMHDSTESPPTKRQGISWRWGRSSTSILLNVLMEFSLIHLLVVLAILTGHLLYVILMLDGLLVEVCE